jgi:hypothetical protein
MAGYHPKYDGHATMKKPRRSGAKFVRLTETGSAYPAAAAVGKAAGLSRGSGASSRRGEKDLPVVA